MNIEKSTDMLGDGEIGNSNYAITSKEAEVVSKALNNILKDPAIKEQIESCYKKDENIFSVYLPRQNRKYDYNEVGLVEDKLYKNSCVGDGDMTVLISAIIKNAKIENIDLNDVKAIERYIKNSFTPELTGITKNLYVNGEAKQ
jgi:hypothetical protein